MASRAQMIRDIRKEYLTETGEDIGAAGADVVLDRMCEAFYQKWAGWSHEGAVRDQPDTAKYLAWQWKGADGRELRAVLDTVFGKGGWA